MMKLSIHRMNRLVGSLCFLVFTCLSNPAHAKSVKLKGSVYSPEAGVICDRKGGFCADSEGLSVALTRMYLGDKAEKKLMDIMRPEPGMRDMDTATFVLTNKVACDCKVKKCRVSKYEDKIDAAHTNALFGK